MISIETIQSTNAKNNNTGLYLKIRLNSIRKINYEKYIDGSKGMALNIKTN